MDAAAVVDVPAHAVTAVFAGELKVVVHDLHITVQLREVFHLVLGQRAVPVGEKPVLELHHRLHFQAPAGAVVDVVVVVLGGVPQQRQADSPRRSTKSSASMEPPSRMWMRSWSAPAASFRKSTAA